MFGAGTSAMMTGRDDGRGKCFCCQSNKCWGCKIIGTATYIYHENKYDKAITGGDVAKTWAECVHNIICFAVSFEGGKSSSKADGKNRGISLLAKDGWSLKEVLLVRVEVRQISITKYPEVEQSGN